MKLSDILMWKAPEMKTVETSLITKLEKQQAEADSLRDAHNFVHKHEDLLRGASIAEIDTAVLKIARALQELRMAKLEAEKAKQRALAHRAKQ